MTTEPAPVVRTMRSRAASTSARVSIAAGAAACGIAARNVVGPIPMRPWRGSPDSRATAVRMASGLAHRKQAASCRILSERALVALTLCEVVTMS